MSSEGSPLPLTILNTSNVNPIPIHNNNGLPPSPSPNPQTSPITTSSSSAGINSVNLLTLQSENDNRISQLNAAIDLWKNINLDARRADIDKQAVAMFEDQQRSVNVRKSLVEMTKNLRTQSDAERLASLGSVVKSYQEEINQLTRRSKFAESAFTQIYKALFEAPDPTNFMINSKNDLILINELVAELNKNKEKLNEYDIEFASLKNQEYTIRKLEAENKEYEKIMQQRVQELMESNAEKLNEEARLLKISMMEQEKISQEKLSIAREQLSRALLKHQQTQQELFNFNASKENAEAARDSANEMIYSELENAKNHIAALQQQIIHLTNSNNKYAQELSTIRGSHAAYVISSQASNHNLTSSSGATFNELEENINELRAQLDHSESNLRQAISESEEKHKKLNGEVERLKTLNTQLKAKCTDLENELDQRPSKSDYNALKKELSLFQEMEYNVELESDDKEGTTQQKTQAEILLFQKNRKLEAELTRIKVELSDRVSSLTRLSNEQVECLRDLAEQRALVTRLEADLAAASNKPSSLQFQSHTHAPLPSTSSTEKGDDVALLLDDSDSQKLNPSHSNDSNSSTSSNNKSNSSGPSMLDIIVHQRDRFRARVELLEKEKYEIGLYADKLVKDLNAMKTDNINLYQKLQYVRSYGKEFDKSNNSAGGSSLNNQIDNESMNSTLNKYSQLYNESINRDRDPFKDFKANEAEGLMQSNAYGLGMLEKITLGVARCMFGRKLFRTFLFAYSLLLHVLVFVVLYTHTISPHCASANDKH